MRTLHLCGEEETCTRVGSRAARANRALPVPTQALLKHCPNALLRNRERK